MRDLEKSEDPGDLGDRWEVAVALPLYQALTCRPPSALKDTARIGCLVQVPGRWRPVAAYRLGPAREIPGGGAGVAPDLFHLPGHA